MISLSSAEQWMTRCLELASKADSAVSPNPRVGCVILNSEGMILGEGWHQRYGGRHAEVHAMDQVREKYGDHALKGATLVVNLEPCNHHGKTPPCSDHIMKSGIANIIVGMHDPNLIATGGLDQLKSAGFQVMAGVLEEQCYRFNEPFAFWQTQKRPYITLKIAQTLDGCIATSSGESKWITGDVARMYVHTLRRETDAVLVGSGTALADNPELTVRHVSGTQPLRIILDGQGKLPHTLRVFNDTWTSKTVAVTRDGSSVMYDNDLIPKGGRVIHVQSKSNHVHLPALMNLLKHEFHIQSLLIEAGPQLASALLKDDLVDRLQLFIAPKLIGHGLHSFQDIGVTYLRNCIHFKDHSWKTVGNDLLFTGYRHPLPW